MSDYYTWLEFRNGVKALLTVDGNRRGTEAFVEGMIRQAVIDLQDFIPAYRSGHETIYLPADFALEGAASVAVLPPQAQVRDAWLVDTSTGARAPVREFPWEKRFDLVYQAEALNDNNGRIAIGPDAYTFYVYPAVSEPWAVSLFWDGLKSQFGDAEEVPFDEGALLAVTDFVKGKLAREVDKDVQMYQTYFHPTQGSYTVKRKNLFLTAKARLRIQS